MFADLLDEALETQSPSLVVVSMRPILYPVDTLDEVSLRSVTDTLPYSSLNRWQMIFHNRKNIVLTGNEVENGGDGEPDRSLFAELPFYFDIWKYHDNWNNIDRDSFNYSRIGSFSSPGKGFRAGSSHEAQERDADVPAVTEKMPLNRTAEKAIRDLMERADKKGFDLLFVVSPYCESAESRMLYNRAAELIAEGGYRSVDFNEFYDEIGIDDTSDYYDSWHLNILGAEKYTAYFIDYLKENYDLSDHRGEASFAAWEEGLGQWEETETEAIEACHESVRASLR